MSTLVSLDDVVASVTDVVSIMMKFDRDTPTSSKKKFSCFKQLRKDLKTWTNFTVV